MDDGKEVEDNFLDKEEGKENEKKDKENKDTTLEDLDIDKFFIF